MFLGCHRPRLFLLTSAVPSQVSLSDISEGHLRTLLRDTKMGVSWGRSTGRTLALVSVTSKIHGKA